MGFELEEKDLNEQQKESLANLFQPVRLFGGSGEINAKIKSELFNNRLDDNEAQNNVFDAFVEKLGKMFDEVGVEKGDTIDNFRKMLSASSADSPSKTADVLNGFKEADTIQSVMDEYNRKTNFRDVSDPVFQGLNVVARNMNRMITQLEMKDKEKKANNFEVANDRLTEKVNFFIRDKKEFSEERQKAGLPAFPTEQQKEQLSELVKKQKGKAVPLKNRIDEIDKSIEKLNLSSEDVEKANRVISVQDNMSNIEIFADLCGELLDGIATDNNRKIKGVRGRLDAMEKTIKDSAPDKNAENILDKILKGFHNAKNQKQVKEQLSKLENSVKEADTKLDASLKEKVKQLNSLNIGKKVLNNAWGKMGEMCEQVMNNGETRRADLLNRENTIKDGFSQREQLKNDVNAQLNIDNKINDFVKRAKEMQTALKACKRAGHSDTREFTNMSNALDEFIKNPSDRQKAEALANAAKVYQAEKQKRTISFTTSMREHRLNCAANIQALGEDCIYTLLKTQELKTQIEATDDKLSLSTFEKASDTADRAKNIDVDDFSEYFNRKVNNIQNDAIEDEKIINSAKTQSPANEKKQEAVKASI